MSIDATTQQVSTRPTPRVAMVGLLTLLVYGAGANIGSGTVLFLAAGMAVGALWSATVFLRHAGAVRVAIEPTREQHEGSSHVSATVVVPRGVIGVIGMESRLGADDERALVSTLGQVGPSCGECARPAHWTPVPPAGSTAQVAIRTILGRGPRQQLHLALDLSDAMGLVRRRERLVGPVVHVVPAHGAAASFRARTVEDEADDRLSHALTGNGAPDAELRTWRPGESIRAVHWAASERVGHLLIRPRAPETTQQRSLGVEDRDWTRTELDAHCRDVAATADRLVAAGVEVEIAAGGQVLPWGREARLLLAGLPPNASDPSPATPPPGRRA